MKLFLILTLQLIVSAPIFSQTASDTIELADPTIFPHQGKYYLYGTVEKGSGNGFLVYVSEDLKSWKLSDQQNGYALRKGDAFGKWGFWAPQVFANGGKFFMAYTANEQLAIAESSSPLGPFTQIKKDSLASSGKQIDPFVFIDDDGKKYLYHVRLTNGNRIFVAEMQNDLSGIKAETVRECINASEFWENTSNAPWPVSEGPTVIKHKKLYYLFYSTNDFRNPDYAVGYATSKNPLGPWKKYTGNPIIVRQMFGINGTGHGDLFKDKHQWYYVFHTHHSNKRTGPRKTALVKVKFKKGSPDTISIVPESLTFIQTK